jgi:hypothetical protein
MNKIELDITVEKEIVTVIEEEYNFQYNVEDLYPFFKAALKEAQEAKMLGLIEQKYIFESALDNKITKYVENDKKLEFPTINNIWFDFDYFVAQLFPICTQEEKNKLEEYGY